MFAKTLEETDQNIITTTKADNKLTGQWFALAGVIIAIVGGLYYAISGEIGAGVIGVLGAISVLTGLLIMLVLTLTAKKTVIDKGQKKVLCRDATHTYDQIDCVVVVPVLYTGYVEELEVKQDRFQILLILKNKDDGFCEKMQRVRILLAEKQNSDSDTKKRLQQAFTDVLPSLQDALQIGESANDLDIWQSAKRIATELQVSLLDMSNKQIHVINAADLDLSLKDYLKRNKETQRIPKQDRIGIQSKMEPDSLLIEYSEYRKIERVLLGFFLMLLISGGTIYTAYLGLFFAVPLAAISLFVIWFTVKISKGIGKNKILGTDRKLVLQLANAKSIHLDLNEIEAMRVNRSELSSLNINTTDKLIKVPMTPVKAQWVIDKIEHFLLQRN